MNIARLEVKAFKGIECIELVPKGSSMVVRGRNRSGKTSLAESIVFALTGEPGKQPVRKGHDSAEVEVTVGDFVFTRVADAASGRTTMKARRVDGGAIPSPAAFLRDIVGTGLALDPTALFRKKDEDQVAEVRRALGINVSEFDEVIERAYAKRTEEGRALKITKDLVEELRAKGAVANGPAPIDAAEAKGAVNAAASRMKQQRDRDERLLRLRAAAEEAIERANEAALALEAFNEPDDPQAGPDYERALAQLTDLGAHNEIARLCQEYREKSKLATDKAAAVGALTNAIDTASKDRQAAIAVGAAKAGIAGLDIQGGALVLNGVRAAELSGVEKIRLGLAIASAVMPKLRTAIVDEAGVFDPRELEDLFKWGADREIQLLLCVPSESEGVEIELVDAEAAAA